MCVCARLCKYSLAIFLCVELPSVGQYSGIDYNGTTINYNGIDPFTGQRQLHPRLVLSAYPEMACWVGEHWWFVAVGVLGIALYMVGMPVAIALILNYISRNQLHTDRSTMLKFGSLYSQYRVSAWRYEIWQAHLRLYCSEHSF